MKNATNINLPSKIKVGYADYKLDFFKRRSLNSEEYMPPMGETWQQKHLIQINIEQAPVECVSTVIHEMLHAISYVFAAGFKNDIEEEKFVEVFSNGLTTVFRDNPELLTWIKNNLTKTK